MIEYKAEHLVLGRGIRYRQQTLAAAELLLIESIEKRIAEDGRQLHEGVEVTRSTNRVGTAVKLVARAVAS